MLILYDKGHIMTKVDNGNKVKDLTDVANASWKRADKTNRGNQPFPKGWDDNSVGKPTKSQR